MKSVNSILKKNYGNRKGIEIQPVSPGQAILLINADLFPLEYIKCPYGLYVSSIALHDKVPITHIPQKTISITFMWDSDIKLKEALIATAKKDMKALKKQDAV